MVISKQEVNNCALRAYSVLDELFTGVLKKREMWLLWLCPKKTNKNCPHLQNKKKKTTHTKPQKI